MSLVIDTNVPVVANGKHEKASDSCIASCIRALLEAQTDVVLVDDSYEIFDEYRRYLSYAGQPGVGDAFFKWLWNNQANPKHCRQVAVTRISDKRGYEEFPDVPELIKFDPSDRKFVAVALASGENPHILNATDSDWWEHRDALQRCSVHIRYLCPDSVPGP